MFIKKGTILSIKHKRKGRFKAEAKEDFNTDEVEFYPVIAREHVTGISTEFFDREEIPCRANLAEIEILKEEKYE